jgi:hypothetical protein
MMPHEAMIDTSAANDSLVFIIPNQKTDSEGEIKLQQKKAKSDSLFPGRQGFHPLNFKSLKSLRFLIHITAYKIYNL